MANQLVEELKKVISMTWEDTTPIGKLGSGAYGVVFECEKKALGTSFGTKEAVKVIKIPRDYDEDYNEDSGLTKEEYYAKVKEEATKEIETMVKLKSPHVVHINEYKVVPQTDQFGWYILIKMDLLQNLKNVMKKHANDSREAAEFNAKKMLSDMCDALEVCFDSGYIHRDIKPENIFMSDKGEYYLGDFGLAKRLEEQSRNVSSRGTEAYVAPEAYTSGCSRLTDIYSLGLVLYKMVNHNCDVFQNPGDNALSKDVAQQIRLSGKEPIELPANCSVEFGEIICKMCAYNPQDRYQSIDEIRSAINQLHNKKMESNRFDGIPQSFINGSEKTNDSGKTMAGNINLNNNTINVNNNMYTHAEFVTVKANGFLRRNKMLLYGLVGVVGIVVICVLGSMVIRNKVSNSIQEKEDIITTNSANQSEIEINGDEAQHSNELVVSSEVDKVNLVDEKIVDGNGARVKTDVEDTLGNKYYEALVIGNIIVDDRGEQYATYYLGKEYKRFLANYSCYEDNRIKNDTFIIEIFGDDQNSPLFHEEFSRANAVSSIDLDVSGIEFLTIKVTGEGKYDWTGMVISDAILYVE